LFTSSCSVFFFFYASSSSSTLTLSLHDALPIFCVCFVIQQVEGRRVRHALLHRREPHTLQPLACCPEPDILVESGLHMVSVVVHAAGERIGACVLCLFQVERNTGVGQPVEAAANANARHWILGYHGQLCSARLVQQLRDGPVRSDRLLHARYEVRFLACQHALWVVYLDRLLV